jgi:tropinone reductase I
METSRWSLKGKYIVLTGATRGIGHATLTEIVKRHEPAGVIICSRNFKDIQRVISELDDSRKVVHGMECDVSKEDDRQRLVNFASITFPRVDCLMNNVGRNVRKNMEEQTMEEYDSIMRTNMDSVYFLCRSLQPLLKLSKGASIVNIASAAGVGSTGTGAAYGASKAAMIQFSKILACEWAKYNIRVNCVAPWMTMTPMLQEAIKGDESSLVKVKEWTPMGRLAEVQDIVDPILFLMMECSGYITGQVLSVDGGLSAQAFQGSCI